MVSKEKPITSLGNAPLWGRTPFPRLRRSKVAVAKGVIQLSDLYVMDEESIKLKKSDVVDMLPLEKQQKWLFLENEKNELFQQLTSGRVSSEAYTSKLTELQKRSDSIIMEEMAPAAKDTGNRVKILLVIFLGLFVATILKQTV